MLFRCLGNCIISPFPISMIKLELRIPQVCVIFRLNLSVQASTLVGNTTEDHFCIINVSHATSQVKANFEYYSYRFFKEGRAAIFDDFVVNHDSLKFTLFCDHFQFWGHLKIYHLFKGRKFHACITRSHGGPKQASVNFGKIECISGNFYQKM